MSNKSDELQRILTTAIGALATADVPGDLRASAFEKSFDFLAADRLSSPKKERAAEKQPGTDSVSDEVALIARKCSISEDEINRVLEIDDGEVHIQVSPSKLSSVKKTAMQEVARIVCAARQASGIDSDWTQSSTIRSACDALGVLDSSNFAQAIKDLKGDGVRLAEESRKFSLKTNAAGYEQAGEIIKRLATQ